MTLAMIGLCLNIHCSLHCSFFEYQFKANKTRRLPTPSKRNCLEPPPPIAFFNYGGHLSLFSLENGRRHSSLYSNSIQFLIYSGIIMQDAPPYYLIKRVSLGYTKQGFRKKKKRIDHLEKNNLSNHVISSSRFFSLCAFHATAETVPAR